MNIEKKKITMLERYGVEYSMQNKDLREKSKQTCLKNWGVEYPTQNKEIFNRQQKSSCQVKQYKDTNLSYQGSWEKYFLEQMESIGRLSKIQNGKSYNYTLDEKQHVYHSDYWFNNSVIEIKSSWTYNKNGKDKELELENETKWQAVRDAGDDIIILKSKNEIINYVKDYTNITDIV